MSHTNHKCACEHTNVKYCKDCLTVYCQDCNQEWKSNWYNPYWTYTNTIPTTVGNGGQTFTVVDTGTTTGSAITLCGHKS
jgi:hypothetical protein